MMTYNEAIRAIYQGYKVALPEWVGEWLVLNKKELIVLTDSTEYQHQLDIDELIKIIERKDFKIIDK